MPEVNFSTRQIELQCLGGQHYAHVPKSFLGEGFGGQRHSRRKFFPNEITQFKIHIFIGGHFHLLAPAVADEATRLNSRRAKTESVSPFALFEAAKPLAKLLRPPGTTQNPC